MTDGVAHEAASYRRELVSKLRQAGAIRSAQVEAAFRAVPRHLFLPEVTLEAAYADRAVPTKYLDGAVVSAASQPTIVAIMLEGLALAPGQRVLEIGAGTGYNAALIADIVGEAGMVTTIDIDEDIVEGARAHLAAAGYDHVHVVHGDGAMGYPAGAPYDRIMLTVGAADIVPAWRAQLGPDGRLMLPLLIGAGIQKVVSLKQVGDHLESTLIEECRFMPLRGSTAGEGQEQWLGGNPGLTLQQGIAGAVDPALVYALLTGNPSADREGSARDVQGDEAVQGGQDYSAAIRLTPDELIMGLQPWLDLHRSGFCILRAFGLTVAQGILPPLFTSGAGEQVWSMTSGLCVGGGLCLLCCPPPRTLAPDNLHAPPFDLHLRSYGEPSALSQVREAVERWHRAGRPSTERMQLRIYPCEHPYTPTRDESAVERPASRLVITWQS